MTSDLTSTCHDNDLIRLPFYRHGAASGINPCADPPHLSVQIFRRENAAERVLPAFSCILREFPKNALDMLICV